MTQDKDMPRLIDDPMFKKDFVDLNLEQTLLSKHDLPDMRQNVVKAALAAGGISLLSLGDAAHATSETAASTSAAVATATTAGLSMKAALAGALTLAALSYGAGRFHEQTIQVQKQESAEVMVVQPSIVIDEKKILEENELQEIGIETNEQLEIDAQGSPTDTQNVRTLNSSDITVQKDQQPKEEKAIHERMVTKPKTSDIAHVKPEVASKSDEVDMPIIEEKLSDDIYNQAREIQFVPVANQQPVLSGGSGRVSGEKENERTAGRQQTTRTTTTSTSKRSAKMSGEVAHFRRAYLAMASGKYEMAASLFSSYLKDYPEGELRIEARIRWLEAQLKLKDFKRVKEIGLNLSHALKGSAYQQNAIELTLRSFKALGECQKGAGVLSKKLKEDDVGFRKVQKATQDICR